MPENKSRKPPKPAIEIALGRIAKLRIYAKSVAKERVFETMETGGSTDVETQAYQWALESLDKFKAYIEDIETESHDEDTEE